MGLPNKLSCEAGSFSCHHNPQKFFQSEVLRLYFPAQEPQVVRSVLLPICSSHFILTQMWGCLVHQPPLILQLLPCCVSPPPKLLVSTPPTVLHECIFFNSVVVRLPYSSIFWQFCLFSFLNLPLSFF